MEKRTPWWDLDGWLKKLDPDAGGPPDTESPLGQIAMRKAKRFMEKNPDGSYKHSAEG